MFIRVGSILREERVISCLQVSFKSLQCTATWTSGFHRHLKHIQGVKKTKSPENNPESMPSISKEEIIPMLQMQMPVLEGPIL